MSISINQPNKYLYFITISNIDSDGYVKSNLDADLTFTSDYYTPELKVSYLAVLINRIIQTNNDFNDYSDISQDSIAYLSSNSDLPYQYPNIYLMIRVICLETFSLAYAINGDSSTDYLAYATTDAITQNIQNINYVVSELESISSSNYVDLITSLQNLAIYVGYMTAAVNTYNNELKLGGYSNG